MKGTHLLAFSKLKFLNLRLAINTMSANKKGEFLNAIFSEHFHLYFSNSVFRNNEQTERFLRTSCIVFRENCFDWIKDKLTMNILQTNSKKLKFLCFCFLCTSARIQAPQ